MEKQTDSLPLRLREELEILEFDTSSRSPQYLVRTKSGRQFQVSESAALLLEGIDGSRNLAEIAEWYEKRSGKRSAPGDIRKIVDNFLAPNGLIEMEKMPPSTRAKSFLYFKLSLFSQQSLSPITRILQFLFAKYAMVVGGLIIVTFHAYLYLIAPRPLFSLTAITLVEGLSIYGVMLLGTLIHELGHSSACRHFKAQHGDIGVGIYLYFFVFYADVSDAWRLRRTERAMIDLGGMYFQLLFIPVLYSAYILSGYSGFLNAIYAMNLQIITCLNPFLRFDGYWLVSDLLGVPNLRKRASEVANYFAKRIARRPVSTKPFMLDLPISYRVFLYGYAFVSNLFFAGFAIYAVFALIPELLSGYPALLAGFYSNLVESFQHTDITILMNGLNTILMPSFMLVMMALMLFGFLRNLSKHFLRKTAGAIP